MKPMEARPEIKYEEPRPRYDISKIKPGSIPYETRLGVNVPVKMEGQYIKKNTGLFIPDTRGATTVEERREKISTLLPSI